MSESIVITDNGLIVEVQSYWLKKLISGAYLLIISTDAKRPMYDNDQFMNVVMTDTTSVIIMWTDNQGESRTKLTVEGLDKVYTSYTLSTLECRYGATMLLAGTPELVEQSSEILSWQNEVCD